MKLPELKKKFKNKFVIRIVAGVLVVAMVGTGMSAYSVQAAKNTKAVVTAETSTADKEEADKDETDKDEEEDLKDALESSIKINEKEIGKEETVYIIADETGKEKKTIVSDHLLNPDGKTALEDASSLKDIKNVKGDEEFSQKGNKLTWQADGNDIYYQGTSTEAAPVTQNITYYLDGKEIAPAELAGKSGKVTMRFDYTNNAKVETEINGKKTEVCVPFMAVSGMVLDDSFRNVEVTNGKVIADGKKNMVIGCTLPGLKESLDVDEEDFDTELNIPDYFEVTADVENFELAMTMTAVVNATNFISAEKDGDDTSAIDELLDSLTDATTQLQDGSAELADGVDTLKDSMGEFTKGVNDLKDGIKAYTDGAGQLNDGIGTLKKGVGSLAENVPALTKGVGDLKAGSGTAAKGAKDLKDGTAALKDGAAALNEGVAALNKNSKGLTDGANQLAAGAAGAVEGVNQINENSATLATGAGDLAAGAAGLSQGINTAVDMISGMGATLDAQKDAAQKAALGAAQQGSLEEANTNLEALKQYQSGLLNAIAAAAAGNMDALSAVGMPDITTAFTTLTEVNGKIAGLAQAKGTADGIGMGIDGVKAKLTDPELAKQLGTLKAGGESVAAGAKTVSEGVKDYTAGVGQLAEKLPELSKGAAALSQGAAAYTDGVGQLAKNVPTLKTGADALADGSSKLADGLNQLDGGLGELNKKVPALADGAKQLTDGTNQLADGASKLVKNSGALNDGASKLKDGTDQIVDGVGQLSDGAHELADGIVTFNEEGIEKILNSYNGDIEPLMERIQAVLDAGADYQTYTDIADGVNGSVKFIYKTDAIKADTAKAEN